MFFTKKKIEYNDNFWYIPVFIYTYIIFLFQYGLYGSFLGCFIYVIFGSCKDIPMGPTAIISLLTYQTISHLDSPVPHAILLCFIVGIVELIMGIFGLGKSI